MEGKRVDCATSEIVDRQLDAYRAGDAVAFAACYAEDCEIRWLPSGRVRANGRAEIEQVWGEAFARGPRRVTILARIAEGAQVIDHEEIEIVATGERQRAVAVFRVTDGLISAAWFFDPAPS
jgi:uncharacterized protein (TIGR02246 family)